MDNNSSKNEKSKHSLLQEVTLNYTSCNNLKFSTKLKAKLTNMPDQPQVLHPTIFVHGLKPQIQESGLEQQKISLDWVSIENNWTSWEGFLAKSVFGGEVREATDEESAVGVADELGIAGGVICKI